VPEVVVSLRELLLHPERFPSDQLLFLPRGIGWTLDTRGVVVDATELEIDPADRDAELGNGMKYALSLSQVGEIVENARDQRDGLTGEELLRAFLYYFDHDAFIRF
jgi:hypothetical protein